MALLDIPTIGNRVMPTIHPVEKLNVGGEGPPPPSGNLYLQPDGVSLYLQPDGVSKYLQPE